MCRFHVHGPRERDQPYKHGIARMYLNLDDLGQCNVTCANGGFEKADFSSELANLERALAELGETLESLYDEAYIARKEDALRRAGIPLERIEIQPEDQSLN